MSFFSDLGSVVGNLQTITGVVQHVEDMATKTPTPVTGAQKLQAAIGLISAVNPAVAADIAVLQGIIGAIVTVLNLFGVFNSKSTTTVA